MYTMLWIIPSSGIVLSICLVCENILSIFAGIVLCTSLAIMIPSLWTFPHVERVQQAIAIERNEAYNYEDEFNTTMLADDTEDLTGMFYNSDSITI